MKKFLIYLCMALMLLIQAPCAANNGAAVYADGLNDGTYKIDVTSSSSMFRVTDCRLTVTDGKMTAVMTLSGKGYEKLFMGTGAEALSAPDSECIYFSEDSEGTYSYTVPVEALDTEINCAAWSIKRHKWYDRTLVFKSDSLPRAAFRGPAIIPAVCGAAAAVICGAAVIIISRKRKNGN